MMKIYLTMPTINKIEKKPKPQPKETDMRKLRATAYNNTQWRKLREVYMHEHPLCEKCLEKGSIVPAEDIHHIRSPFKGGAINYELLLNHGNLLAVCKKCHQAIHNQKHMTAEQIIEQLDALFNPEISDKDIEDGNY